jgi:hypothetical protein
MSATWSRLQLGHAHNRSRHNLVMFAIPATSVTRSCPRPAHTAIAQDFQVRFKLNPLRAFREAHRLTQAGVVHRWNQHWPDDPLSERRLGAWEALPGLTGNEPPLAGLERLAKIYQCRAGDLVDGD